jgi:ribosomal protein S18 acetylase RimI-like enzyme
MTSTAAAVLMDRLGLAEEELCTVLGVDPLTVIAGDLDDKPQLPILLALTGEAAERVGEDVLRGWLRATGPRGRPLDHLLAGDYAAFEDDLATLADRGFVVRGGGGGGGAARRPAAPRVRRIRPDEGETLRAIRLRALADAPLAFGSTHARENAYPPERWRDWAQASSAGGAQAFFFATDAPSDAPVGLASGAIRDTDPRTAHLYAMWVAPEARGSGAGAALVDAVVGWARERGAARVLTEVTVGNDTAARLYERAGFRDTGERAPLGHSDAQTALLARDLRD